MTNIELSLNPRCTKINIHGHSRGKRTNGIDLCCCSVSTLCYTLTKPLLNLNLPQFSYILQKGECSLSFANRGPDVCRAFAAIETVMNGFKLLKETYPQNINLTGGFEQ